MVDHLFALHRENFRDSLAPDPNTLLPIVAAINRNDAPQIMAQATIMPVLRRLYERGKVNAV